MSADLQALLRFLSQDAKVPLATALSKVKKLQTSNLDSTAKLAQSKPAELQAVFEDEKLVKQILAAAKRVSKKRAAAATAAGDDDVLLHPSPKKKKKKLKNDSLFDDDGDKPLTPANLEGSLQLPYSTCDASELEKIILQTNRAPLVLAFVVILLKYTMPEQPLSSRLSLAQAYVSVSSRSRAVYLGIESGKSAKEEGFGEGQPVVSVAGKQITVLRRWGYEWKEEEEEIEDERKRKKKVFEKEIGVGDGGAVAEDDSSGLEASQEESPALWALDLEALKKKSGSSSKQPAGTQAGNYSGLPIYTPQSARAYLLKSFATPEVGDGPAAKKLSATARFAEKETNLGKLLRALDLLYDSWTPTMSPAELDQKTWSWYAKVRPPVEDGVAGWGEKNQLKLADILALRCMTDT